MNRQQKISALISLICNTAYGETISHSDISRAIEEAVNSQKYRGIVSAAKKRCVELGRATESIRGVGYRLILPDEYTNQSVKQIVSGAKRIDAGVKILTGAPVREMSQTGLESYNQVSDRVRILQASVAGAKVEISMLSTRRQNPLLTAQR